MGEESTFEQCLRSASGYVEAMHELSYELSDAFFQLSRARYALSSPSALEQLPNSADLPPGSASVTSPADDPPAISLQPASAEHSAACTRRVAALPPPALRSAQSRFQHVLELAVRCARLRLCMHLAVSASETQCSHPLEDQDLF